MMGYLFYIYFILSHLILDRGKGRERIVCIRCCAKKDPPLPLLRSAQLSGAFTLSHHPKSCYLHPTFQAQLQPCLLQEALQDIPPPLTSFYPHCLCPALVFLVLPHGLSPKETLTKAPCGQGLGLLRFDSCLA